MNLLFDLDGTLTDPFWNITRCIAHALTALGRSSPPPDSLRWCIGPPLKQSLSMLLGSDNDPLVQEALRKYRERFGATGIFENEVYGGIPETLDALRGFGHKLYVATSKPTVYAEQIINHFGLGKYFERVFGSELDGTRSDKSELISYITYKESILPWDAIVIGDREHDMIGAGKNGVFGLGVLWGYGTEEELKAAGAYACIETPQDLVAATEGKSKKAEAPP
jgi:phosphoglycolate phosphatase